MTIVSMVVLVFVLVVGETIQTTPQDSKLQYPSILRFCLDIVQAVLEFLRTFWRVFSPLIIAVGVPLVLIDARHRLSAPSTRHNNIAAADW